MSSDDKSSLDKVAPDELPQVQERKVAPKTFGAGSGEKAEGEEEGKPKVIKLNKNDPFRMKGKNMRHYAAHCEYGVVFSLCGIRTSTIAIEVGPMKEGEQEIECNKCEYTLRKEAAK